MLLLPVLIQPFAMVGEQHDRGAIVDPLPLQVVEELADDRVRRGDLAVVRRARVLAAKFGSRRVRRVRLEEVEEEEERLLRAPFDPALGDRFRFGARPLQAADRLAALHLDVVVVEVEGLRQSAVAAEHVRGDGRTGGVALLLQQRRDRRVLRRVEAEADVVAHAVVGRQLAGEERDVRRERERHVRVGVREEDGIVAEPVEVRGLDAGVAVRGEVIRAQGVDRDHDHRRVRIRRRGGRGRAAGEFFAVAGGERDESQSDECETFRHKKAPRPRPGRRLLRDMSKDD